MKVGIFGGTFDPPHIGHINMCKAFIDMLNLDVLYVIPARIPPHKTITSNTKTHERLEMARLAFDNISDKVIVSDMEIKREGKSYTADTIRYFKENMDCDLYFLCGTDMLLSFDTWYMPDYIFDNATIVYARRENDKENSEQIPIKISEYEKLYNAKIIHLDVKVIEVSSSEIRREIDEVGKSSYLTCEVLDFILKNNLYNE